ncbi:MAG: UDP-N-acetylmuramoyl-L-alanine--D-glutamate ligase, partial [Clostridia bacterium]|nr:UDP-N-acetylmuramoyl-L-alanine--D-glutamate ligase [Clostridia bacterium]
GSDGKTTTTTIIARLLERAGKRVWLGGNIGRALLPFIHEVQPEDVAVVELSSFQLTNMTQSPYVAVVTNVSPNHLDWHTDMREYIDAKRNLVTWQKAGDRAVLNADDETTAAFAEGLSSFVTGFSRKSRPETGAFLREDGVLCAVEGETVTPVIPAVDIRIPGVHNVENYLAAIAAVWGEVPAETIADFAREFGGVEHRSEWVRTVGGARWYNDSIGSSPSRTIAGLRAFDRKVILIAGGYDKNIPYDPLGEVAKDTVKAAVLLGATADKIDAAIRAHSDLPIYRVSNLEEAVVTARRLAGEGDIVFFSPASASFDMYKNFEERGRHFKGLVNEMEG